MISFRSHVKKIEFKKRVVRGRMEGDKAVLDEEDLGWFVLLDGSHEFLHVGTEKPDFSVGQQVTVKISGD